MKVWLENEQVAASKLILTLEAKRGYVLQHEEMLRNAAAQLRQLQDLEHFVNPPQLAGTSLARERPVEGTTVITGTCHFPRLMG